MGSVSLKLKLKLSLSLSPLSPPPPSRACFASPCRLCAFVRALRLRSATATRVLAWSATAASFERYVWQLGPALRGGGLRAGPARPSHNAVTPDPPFPPWSPDCPRLGPGDLQRRGLQVRLSQQARHGRRLPHPLTAHALLSPPFSDWYDCCPCLYRYAEEYDRAWLKTHC